MTGSETIVERALRSNLGSLNLLDLLAIALARRQEDVEDTVPIAQRALLRYRNISRLADATAIEFRDMAGLEEFEVLQRRALLELGRRMQLAGQGDPITMDRPESIVAELSWLQSEKREHFIVVMLNVRCHLIRTHVVHIGTLDASLVSVRDVFREPIREGAASIVVAHNHPSGVPEPSLEDVKVSKMLVEAGNLLEIGVADSLIIGSNGNWTSLKRMGML